MQVNQLFALDRSRRPFKHGFLAACLFLWITTLLFSTVARAQSPNLPCGFDSIHQSQLVTDSRYRALVNQIQNNLLTNGQGVTSTDDVYTIPVVFVVYHVGEAVGTGSNIADDKLIEQMALLNRYFAADPPFSEGVNSGIRFVLAQRSPVCQASTGIIRVDARAVRGYQDNGVTNYADAFRLLPLLPEYGSSRADRFVFIRVVRNLTFAAGFATFGGGIFVDAGLMTNTQNGNTLLGHEMGHVFFLHHTFQGSDSNGTYVCPPNTNPVTDGDQVADTDPHKQFDPPNCTASAINACTGQPFGPLVNNIMNYSPCRNRFTVGQVNRMRLNLAGPLASLVNSPYRYPPGPAEALVSPVCPVTYGVAPDNYDVGISAVIFNSIHNESGSSPGFDGFYTDYSCSERTTVQPGMSYAFQAVSTNPVTVYIDYNNDGAFDEASERVLTYVNAGDIVIPQNTVKNTYLRMRVVTDPGLGQPTACYLPGHPVYGSGEIEDYGLQIQVICAAFQTINSGDWHDPAIWSCGRVPGPEDPVMITAGHSVTVSTTVQARTIRYQAGGILVFSPSGSLFLAQP